MCNEIKHKNMEDKNDENEAETRSNLTCSWFLILDFVHFLYKLHGIEIKETIPLRILIQGDENHIKDSYLLF